MKGRSMDTPKTSISIQGISFDAPQPYIESHICTAAEAAILNSVLADHLRSNFAKRVKSKIEAVASESMRNLNATETIELRHQFRDYAAKYSFTAAAARLASADPVDRMAWRIAKDLVIEALQARGTKPGDDPEFESRVATVATRPKVREEAQRRVDATRGIVADALEI